MGFDGASTGINFGSPAALDDLPSGAVMTVEGWFRDDAAETSARQLIQKGNWSAPAGWCIYRSSGLYGRVFLDSSFCAPGIIVAPDGKWHHVAMYYNDTTKMSRIALDGVWSTTSTGVGVYSVDNADDLVIGKQAAAAAWYWNGGHGWWRISDNDRHGAVAGTDFIPPREFPAADGNTVEAWSLNDGTGATAAAQVTSPGNDGTISNGTWEQQWDDVLTPVYPTSLEFDGAATGIDCGSAAALDNLPNGAILNIDAWVRYDPASAASYLDIVGKTTSLNGNGWMLEITTGGNAQFKVVLATTNMIASRDGFPRDGKWHFVTCYYDDTTKTGRVAVDGLWGSPNTGVGAYQLDAAADLVVGKMAYANLRFWDGAIGWLRLSDNDRFGAVAGTTFVPPDRVNPPGADGNTIEQWNIQDGAGLTAIALVTTPGNDGTITMGTGRWWNTPDASPGPRIFQWGYDIGSDAANDGVHQHQAGLDAGENYVARVPVRYEADGRCQPSIVVYDETNGAAISTFLGPWLTGIHDGGDGVAALVDSTAPYWPYSLVSGTIHNITDGSSATITAAGNSIAATLAGGTNDDWDDDDVYLIVPPDEWVWVEPFCFELPTIDRNGAAADCIEISFRLLNSAGEGVIYWQQVELLENLLDNPSLETGAGNPWIPDGWANTGLDAGDTQASSTGGAVIHSGSDCIQWNVGATINEGAYDDGGGTPRFVSIGVWSYSTGTAGNYIGFANINQGTWQYSTTVFHRDLPTPVAWMHTPVVGRIVGGIGRIVLTALTSVGTRYLDDVYMVDLDDVSLTCTPASKANSAETSGLRVDGTDQCTQTQYRGKNLSDILNKNNWEVEFEVTPRHDAADIAKFGASSPDVLWLWGDANNYLYVDFQAASIFRLVVNVGGGGEVADKWDPATLDAGTTYTIKIKGKRNSKVEMFVDGILRCTINQPITWGTTPSTAHWGHHYAGGLSYDATFN